MSKAEWLGLGGALIMVGPFAWYTTKDLLAEFDKARKARRSDEPQVQRQPPLGFFAERIEVLGQSIKVFYHLILPFVLFFTFWNVFTIWANSP